MTPALAVTKPLLPATWLLPEEITSRLGDTAGRQRPMQALGHLLLILHEPPGPDDAQRVGRFFWREPDGSWKSNNLGPGAVALRKHVQEFFDRIETLDDEIQTAEQADDYFRVLKEVAPLNRTIRNMHATLQQAREMAPDDHDLINIRDLAGSTERASELLSTDARNGLDFTMARAAEDQSRRAYQMAVSAHRLNIMAAIFLPVATLGSIMGMELASGLDRDDPVIFWTLALGAIMAGFLLTITINKKPKLLDDRPSRQKRKRRK